MSTKKTISWEAENRKIVIWDQPEQKGDTPDSINGCVQ